MSSSYGKFVWYDVMTTDTKAAKSFYCDVVGWDANDPGMPGRSYSLFSAGPTIVGGLMSIPDDARKAGVAPAWMGYIDVDDVDACARRVKAAGGSIHRGPENAPPIGRFAVAGDPHGAGFVLFKGASTQAPTPGLTVGLGHVGWHELHAGEREAAFAFYSRLFGWTKVDAVDMGGMGIYQIFAIDGAATGGIMTKMPEVPRPFWLYYFNVDSIDAAAARVKNGGGTIANGPLDVLGGSWILQGFDPQGAMFGLVAPKR